MFHTFTHSKNEDCPAYEDRAKRIYNEPVLKDGKIFYPCNIGGCLEGCKCSPCNDQNVQLKCPDHAPDHPELFNPQEDISITRRQLFDVV